MKLDQELNKLTLEIINHQKYKALAGVIMMGNVTLDDSVSTACTDGVNVKYGTKWFGALKTPAHKRFLILHENGHKALRQIRVWHHLWKDDPELANKAADFVINLWLTDIDDGEGFTEFIEGGCLDEKYRGMDTGEVFRILKQEKQGGGGKGQGQPGQGQGQPGQGQGQPGQGQGQPGASGGEAYDEHDIDAYDKLTAEEKETLAKAVDTALRQGGILAGRGAGGLDRTLIESMEPEINWREQLREFLNAHCADKQFSTWAKVNRKYVHSGIYMPGMAGETIGRMGCFQDTSGSIDDALLGTGVSEVVSAAEMLQPELIDLMYWDTEIARHEKYGPGEYQSIKSSTKPAGGGGTSPSCITEYIKKNAIKLECAIVFTDGYVGNDWGGTWPCPVLWVVIGNRRASAPVGKTIHINR